VQKYLKEGIQKTDKQKKAAKIAHGLSRVDQDLKYREEKIRRMRTEITEKKLLDEEQSMMPVYATARK